MILDGWGIGDGSKADVISQVHTPNLDFYKKNYLIVLSLFWGDYLTNIKIEEKWQKKWQETNLFQSDPNNEKKIFVTVAYPYPSGAMHIGHGRTYTVPDVYA